MEYKPVQITNSGMADNKFRDNGKVWLVSNLIERAKDLEPFDLPLCAMFTGSRIWEPIETAYGLAVHMKRVQEANLDFPIILDAEGFDVTPAPDYTEASS
jgi:hypothetical protein